MKIHLSLVLIAFLASACSSEKAVESGSANDESAEEFVERINAELAELSKELGAAAWVRATYITHDTAILSSLASQKYSEWHSRSVEASLAYADQELAPETARALNLLKLGTAAPAPDDPVKRAELAQITTDLSGMYGAGEYCPDDGRECMALGELERIMAQSRDYDENLDAWVGWRTVSVPMRDKYRRFAELANEGARELGYGDLGEMWNSGYDMSAAEFEQESLRLWNQVKPLYDELHCHVRSTLAEEYGEDKVPLDQPIPAHLLGNMWAQSWDNLYDLLEPNPGIADLNIDRALTEQN
ncbi:MAG TPA: M2 family metallopeptidase, partial [Woeseiaceae bacterium]